MSWLDVNDVTAAQMYADHYKGFCSQHIIHVDNYTTLGNLCQHSLHVISVSALSQLVLSVK